MSEISSGPKDGVEPVMDDIAKDKWVKGFCDFDISKGRGRGIAIGSDREDPKRLEYGIALGKHLEGLEALGSHESHSDKVKTAQGLLNAELEKMHTAAEKKDYGKAIEHLNAAIPLGTSVQDEIDESNKDRDKLFQRYNGIVDRRQPALDMLPSTARLAEAKATVVKADKVLQPLMEGPVYGAPAEEALTKLIEALDKLDQEKVKAEIEVAKYIKDAKAGLLKLATETNKAIAKLATGPEKKRLTELLADFARRVTSLSGISDTYELNWQISKLEPEGNKLLADALKASSATQEDREAAFAEILAARFDIKIKIPPGMTNTHLEKAYEMFLMVPPDHVGHDMLKKLVYLDATGEREGGAYYDTSAKIEMGGFDGVREEDYEIDGEVQKANSFNVTTLHEIGHAVDAKFDLMGKYGRNPAAGAWKIETLDEVAQAFLTDFKGNNTLNNVDDGVLLGEIKDALTSGDTRRLDGAFPDDTDWAKIEPLLVRCASIRDGTGPWKRIVKAGNRAYHQSYSWEWVSYDPDARTSTYVNEYQWRSHAEWFAEIYAITWLKKKEPPAAIDPAIAAYMWGGASIGTR
jgi:hypothetical protein